MNILFFCFFAAIVQFESVSSSYIEEYQVEELPSFRGTVLEETHWDQSTNRLYYVDIAGVNSSIQCYHYRANKVYKAHIDDVTLITYIIPVKCVADQFLVGTEHRSYIVQWNGKSPKAKIIEPVFDLDCGEKQKPTVINDLKTDPYGRIYGGMKSVESCDNLTKKNLTGSFYRYEKGKCPERLFGNVYISNGLTWIGDKFFYADSCTYDIKQFHYNPKTGDIAYERELFSLIDKRTAKKPNYLFDGMTSDKNGIIYATTFGGSQIYRICSRTGKVLPSIKMPTSQITDCAFGGPNLDILYVTTANKDGSLKEPAGRLFKVTGLDTSGPPMVEVKLYDSCESLEISYTHCNPFCSEQPTYKSFFDYLGIPSLPEKFRFF